jgi:hypothetical protein
MDGASRETNVEIPYGEVVWSWRPKAGAALRGMTRGNGDNNVWFTGESTKDTVKTICAGKAGCSARTCGSAACFFTARGPWVQPAPGLPCALSISRAMLSTARAKNASRDYTCVAWLFDIQIKALRRGSRGRRSHRRHCERSEAIQNASAATVWIASSLTLLAMTQICTHLLAFRPAARAATSPRLQ